MNYLCRAILTSTAYATSVFLVVSLFSSRCFLKEVENMFSVFPSSYRDTRKILGELEKAVETLACGSGSHRISRSPKLPLVLLYLEKNTVHVFYFLNTNNSNNGP